MMDRRTVREFYPKNKFEKLLHLVCFIIRIYHNARSPERQKGFKRLTGFEARKVYNLMLCTLHIALMLTAV